MRLLLVYFQVVQLPKETYATDIHWFPPGVSSKKTSNQSDLFVLACTDGQSHVTCMIGHVTFMMGHVTCMIGHVTCMIGHVTCMIGHVTC